MATWPTTPLPVKVTDFEVPGPLISRAQSGKVNTRSTQQRGRSWTEKYLLHMRTNADRALLAAARNFWRAGTIVDIKHQDYLTPLGPMNGTPLVNGASQTGSTLNIDGATINQTPWVRAGDIFTIAGINQVYECTADANSDGSGLVAIPISPPIFSGGSPVDGNALTVTAVILKVILIEPPDFPETNANSFGVLSVAFTEAL